MAALPGVCSWASGRSKYLRAGTGAGAGWIVKRMGSGGFCACPPAPASRAMAKAARLRIMKFSPQRIKSLSEKVSGTLDLVHRAELGSRHLFGQTLRIIHLE